MVGSEKAKTAERTMAAALVEGAAAEEAHGSAARHGTLWPALEAPRWRALPSTT